MSTKKITLLIRIIFIFAVPLVACKNKPATQPDQGTPDAGAATQAPPAEDENVTPPYHGAYTFHMKATVLGLASMMVPDTLESEWDGEFTVDASGQIVGEGTFTYIANVYAVDEKQCGFVWEETGTYTFKITGTVRAHEDTFITPVLLDPSPKSSQTSGPTETCAKPANFLSKMPPSYVSTHLKPLVFAVLGAFHKSLNNQLVFDNDYAGEWPNEVTLNIGVGDVDYEIIRVQFTYDPFVLVPLED